MSEYIPIEIQVQILKYLPVKSVLRFRCICKWWKQLIDSQSFVQDHLAVQNPRFLLECKAETDILILDGLTLPSFDILRRPIQDQQYHHLVGTLHGIVCLYDTHESISLWNPSIRKLSTLPFPEFLDYKWLSDGDDLVYNYGAGTYSAFWINPSTKNYKIIIFQLTFYGDHVRDGAIYSSIEGHWKKLPLGEVRKCKRFHECPAVVIGGVAYWRAFCFEVTNEGEMRKYSLNVVLLSFDFGLDRFDIIQAPSVQKVEEGWEHPVLYKWKDNLSLAYLRAGCSRRCDIYLRREGSWLHMIAFNLPSSVGRLFWVLGEMDGTGKVLVEEEVQQNNGILSTIRGELVLCCNRAGCISLKRGQSKPTDFYIAYDFVESLLFP